MRFIVEDGTLVAVGLHNGDSFPESEVSPAPERVRDMKLLSEAGTLDAENMHVSGKTVQGQFRIRGKSSYVVIARTTPHALQLSAKDFSAYLKEEGLEETLRWREEHGESQLPGRERYAKYAKSLLTSAGNNEFHTRPTNLAMEIVPESSPYDLKSGATLPVKVLLEGQPAVNAQVETSLARAGSLTKTTILGRTDAQGRIVLPTMASGRWRIHSVVMKRSAEPAIADWESSWASLTFELP